MGEYDDGKENKTLHTPSSTQDTAGTAVYMEADEDSFAGSDKNGLGGISEEDEEYTHR